jgi:FYVE zinc finger
MPSQNQARSLARSWTPPRMHHFSNYKFCHLCKNKFALLRRACHCRNCGVCICKDCAIQWPAKMIPDTYNIKKENVINVCKSCDWLCMSFRLALLNGNHDRSVSLYSTGNVNLHTPFANVKGEVFYPVHCAVLGGNLDLLKFLVDENCCPIRSIRVAGSGKESSNKAIPIVTSKGRSLLGIAMENENLSIVRYLVAEKGLSLLGEKDLTHDLLCRNFEKLLRVAPEDSFFNPNYDAVLNHFSVDIASVPTTIGGNVTGLEPMASESVHGESNYNHNNVATLQGEASALTMNNVPPPLPERAAPRRRSSHGLRREGFPDVTVSNAHEECT